MVGAFDWLATRAIQNKETRLDASGLDVGPHLPLFQSPSASTTTTTISSFPSIASRPNSMLPVLLVRALHIPLSTPQ